MDNSTETYDDLGFGDFRSLYRKAIKRSGKSQTAIALEIGHKNQGFVSAMLNREAAVPVDKLKEWLVPLGLSDDEFATLYRKGLEEFAPEYVKELISNFTRFHEIVMRGEQGTLPSIDKILMGRIPHRT